jgi:hypothetical protein
MRHDLVSTRRILDAACPTAHKPHPTKLINSECKAREIALKFSVAAEITFLSRC